MERLLPLAFLLLTALLSGCAGEDPQAAAQASPGPGQADEAEPVAGAGTADGAAGPSEPVAGTCRVTINAGTGVQGNFQNAYLGCRFSEADAAVGSYGWALVEAAFPDAPPTLTRFYLYIQSESCDFNADLDPCWHDTTSSETPALRMEVGSRLLEEFAGDGLRAHASLDGVAVQQDIVIAVTLVPEGQQLPEGYTALG